MQKMAHSNLTIYSPNKLNENSSFKLNSIKNYTILTLKISIFKKIKKKIIFRMN
jgi:hypothetical protein